jgi:hypothetical protein
MFKGSRLLRTQHRLNGSDMFVVKEVTMPTSVPNPHTRPPEIAVSTPAPTHGANSVPIAAKQNYKCGRVNHVTMEEAQEAQDVVIDMFFINDTSAVVLFNSRASHSFISVTYVGKHNLPLALLKCQMIVSSSGGDMPAR